MKFRKKPIVIEAVRWDGDTFINGAEPLPGWLYEAMHKKPGRVGAVIVTGDHRVFVQTLEGPLLAAPGDWIIRGVKGELYPCKPDIFEATYDPVEE